MFNAAKPVLVIAKKNMKRNKRLLENGKQGVHQDDAIFLVLTWY